MSRSFLADAAEKMSAARRVELRDSFAGQAMAALISYGEIERIAGALYREDRNAVVSAEERAEAVRTIITTTAYSVADAMLAARERVPPGEVQS